MAVEAPAAALSGNVLEGGAGVPERAMANGSGGRTPARPAADGGALWSGPAPALGRLVRAKACVAGAGAVASAGPVSWSAPGARNSAGGAALKRSHVISGRSKRMRSKSSGRSG